MAKRLFYTKLGWQDNSISNIERNIKLFALINTDLVVPSNHMYSEKAEFLFKKRPELLGKKLIRPAISDEFHSFSEYFDEREKKAGRKLSEYGKYLDSIECFPLKYTSNFPATIFTKSAIEQISNSKSVVRKATTFSDATAQVFLDKISIRQEQNQGVVFFRDFLDISKEILDNNSYIVMDRYVHLVRYISGASSKRCNNLLPQENLIDWCLANSDNRDNFILQDEQLFWEVFLESIIKITEGIFTLKDLSKLSPTILDRLNYNDIYDLRSDSILQNKFVKKYDSIIDKINIIRTTSQNYTELVDFEELISLKEQLRIEFMYALQDEISIYHKIEIIEALVKIAYQLWGGSLQSIESVINFFSITFNRKHDWEKFLKKQEKRVLIARDFAKKRLSKETTLLDYMDKIVIKTKDAWYK